MTEFSAGTVHTTERTFTESDVRAFADLSRDRQDRHLEPGADGRLLVHGLLTATLPTEIGGDLAVLATRMDFHFRRKVYTGERIRCRWEHEHVEERGERQALTVAIECTVDGETVLDGTIEGIVRV